MGDVAMPRLSDSMEEGTIIRWLKADGDEVSHGEELVEIETDKANMTYEADADGVLEIVAGEGDTLPIGELIARIGGSNGASPSPAPAPAEDRAGEEEAPTPPSSEPAGEETPPSPSPPSPSRQPAPAGAEDGDGRVRASPVARRIAEERGVDLAGIEGSGPGGRVVKADVEGREPASAPAAAPERGPVVRVEGAAAKGDVEVRELTRTQQVIARRMAEAKATVPEFTLTADVDMGAAVRARAEIKEVAERAPSFNDFVVKASALALREFPRANGAYRDGRWELHSRVNVGVAVAVEGSLVVPTVFDADRRSLGEIAAESRGLAQRVREGSITPPELAGGTFTVSNLGMFGITSFTAVINPPQAAILAVGAIREEPVVRAGAVVPGHRMSITLACDHRILYGADAAQFLARVVALLEHPAALAL